MRALLQMKNLLLFLVEELLTIETATSPTLAALLNINSSPSSPVYILSVISHVCLSLRLSCCLAVCLLSVFQLYSLSCFIFPMRNEP